MPLRDRAFWSRRQGDSSPCHYRDRWLDAYADLVRKAALVRIFPRLPGLPRVLDVGCGDAKLSAWMARRFHCEVWGIDAVDWPGAAHRMSQLRKHLRDVRDQREIGPFGHFAVADAETMSEIPWLREVRPHLAVAITSLPFSNDWRLVVSEMCRLADRVLVLDNLQTPSPPWQRGLPYKEPVELAPLVCEFASNGFMVERGVGVNVLDRALFRHLLAPLAFAITLPLDIVLARLVRAHRWRYAAVLFQRVP